MTKTKCIICKKRYVTQRDWHTERENIVCMTCDSTESMVKSIVEALESQANERGLTINFTYDIKPYEN